MNEGDAWAVDSEARTLLRIERDVRGRRRARDRRNAGRRRRRPAASVWVANGRRREAAQSLGPVATSIVRFDPATSREEETVALPSGGVESESATAGHLAATRDAVWAVTSAQSVVRIDPTTAEITATASGLRASAIAAGGAGVWVLGFGGRLLELDERTARIRRRVKLPASDAGALAVGDDAVWVAGYKEPKLWRIGRDRGDVIGAVDLQGGGSAVAVAGDRVWVANAIAGDDHRGRRGRRCAWSARSGSAAPRAR